MGTNNGNGRPKLMLDQNVPRKVRLLRNKPFNGSNGTGPYHLYSVADSETGQEMAFFAPEEVHRAIEDLRLGKDQIIQLTKINNKIELAVVGNQKSPEPQSDNLKEILAGCIRDTISVVKDCGIQWSNDEVERLVVAMFIARTR